MSNSFLSQEEIDSLLNGDSNYSQNNYKELNDIEKDLIGEVGNISMGAAATTLYQIINNTVNITTPSVKLTTLKQIKEEFKCQIILLDVKYTEGIDGKNILAMKTEDASLIANLMMGGDGSEKSDVLSEIEISAVMEAMNQMIGSSATAMSTMFSRGIKISPPELKVWENPTDEISQDIDENETVIEVIFDMKIGNLLETKIMQILTYDTAKKIVSIMMGTGDNFAEASVTKDSIESNIKSNYQLNEDFIDKRNNVEGTYMQSKPIVEVNKASFQNLSQGTVSEPIHNIDLIMDVPLDVSVVLGRTKKSIREILDLGNGSLISLDKLAEEPVEVLINGKTIAFGEVVVVDENFGVRISSIVSNADRIKSLK